MLLKEFAKDTNDLLDEALRNAHNITRELRVTISGLGGQLSNSLIWKEISYQEVFDRIYIEKQTTMGRPLF